MGRITSPIAGVGGNIVDLRQDVLHGLFTIYLVVDLTACDLRIDKFKDIIKSIAEDTGLALSVDTYHPVARNPEKKNILVILIGSDKPGIIASIAKTLGNYKANIEFAKNIGREGLFPCAPLAEGKTGSARISQYETGIPTASFPGAAGQGQAE